MGTLRGDNGGERPREDDGLPGLPPEWGTVVIPDDPAALDREGASLRRRFRRAAFRRRWRRRLRLRPKPMVLANDDSPGLAIPLLIMAVAIIATLTSLFAIAWPDRRVGPDNRPSVRTSSTTVNVGGLVLLDAAGHPVNLASVTPAVILLVDGCACDTLIKDTYVAVAGSAPTGTTGGATAPTIDRVTLMIVATVLPTLPTLPTAGAGRVRVSAYSDPNRSVRAGVPALSKERTGPAVILVNPDGTVLTAVADLTSITQFQNQLSRL